MRWLVEDADRTSVGGKRPMNADPSCQHELLKACLAKLNVARGPDAGGFYTAWYIFHADGLGKPPHQPNLRVSAQGYFCHACQAKGNLRSLVEQLCIRTDGEDKEAVYDYRDDKGELLFQVVRLRGKKFRQRRPDGNGRWIWKLEGVRRVLYRLPDLLNSDHAPVHIVEGEKDADNLASLGLTATTNPNGAGKWRDEYSEFLRGRDVVILPDNDNPGLKHAEQVARSLTGIATSVKVVRLPDLPEKGDVSDWFMAGHTKDELKQLAESTAKYESSAAPAINNDAGSGAKASQADFLVGIVLDSALDLFHDEVADTYARLPMNDHVETWRCRGRPFKEWAANRLYQVGGKAPSSEALGSALNVLCAKARFEGKEHRLWNRVARHHGAIWYDLADRNWRAVRIAPGDWTLVEDPPCLFRRYAHQRDQVEPVRGRNLQDLLEFINVPDELHRLLLLVYLVSCYVPDIPHPIPDLHGSQGSGKTTLFRMLRRLVDPSRIEVLSFPRSGTELVQQLSHHWCAYFDNVGALQAWTSDMLARAVTGEGFSKRELYSDDEDVIYNFRRCVGLNGINVVARKPDLLDRCILFQLDTIDPGRRRPEKELWSRFEQARPSLLGAAFDVLAKAMAILPGVHLGSFPRMADFVEWGCAISEALGHSQDDFLRAYEANITSRNDEVLLSHPIATAAVALMEDRDTWEGTPSDLLEDLDRKAKDEHLDVTGRHWPKAAHILTRRLNEVRPNLAAAGIRVGESRTGRRRMVTLERTPGSVTSVTGAATDRTDREPGTFRLERSPEPKPAASHQASPTASHAGLSPHVTWDGCDANNPFRAFAR